jgi:hypothetical protein
MKPEDRASAALPELPGIAVVDGCGPRDIPAEVFESDVPLKLPGLVSEWPAVRACSPALESARRYLAAFQSNRPVQVWAGEPEIGGRFFYNEDCTGFNFRRGGAPLGLVLQKMSEQLDTDPAPAIYVGSTAVDGWLPGFRDQNDIEVPADDALVSFWIGNRTRISAHFDYPDNIACVVAGRRRFTLFPPDAVENLYIGPLDLTPAGQAISLVDLKAPDFERFPKFREALASACVCELEPGDAIFVPSMWWHHVESLSPFNMLVNYWWFATPAVMGNPMDALRHAMLSVRGLPQRQRDAWRFLFEHYVFSAEETNYEHIPEAGRGSLSPLDDEAAKKLRARLIQLLQGKPPESPS